MRPGLSLEVAAPGALVWQQLIDLDSWPRWGPTVRSARLEDCSRQLSAGATGTVQTAVGVWLPFEVENWVDDGPVWSWSWRVAGVSATEHAVISRGASRCRVEMTVPWWAGSYLGVVGVGLARIRRHAEGVTGD